ncbi:MAG: glycosyltransferase [Verrucomicrobia bacterium]|nr:glycosyltransferase [Verrucomicrobiota bacterium]
MAKEGNDVFLLAPNRPEDCETGVANIFDFYNVDNGFKISKLFWPKLKFFRGQSAAYAVAAALEIWRINPDLVIGRHVHSCALAAWIGYSTIYERHSPIWDTGWRKYLSFKYLSFRLLRLSPNLQKLILITEALRESYVKHESTSQEVLQVVPDAADAPAETDLPAEVSSSERVRAAGREKTLQVGYVGNLYPGKGMKVIVEVASLMPEVDFHVVGGLVEDILKWKKRSDSSNVHFHGFVDQKKVPCYIQSFDVCLLPNQRRVETRGGTEIGGFTSPLKMFEYMSMGKAIVASNLPVLQEVLTHKKNAILCDPEKIEQWVASINYLKQHPEVSKQIGKRARDDFIANHTWDIRAQRVLENID